MKKGLLCIITAGILWGSSGVFVRLFSAYGLTSLQITALRLSGAFLMLFAYCILHRRTALRTTLRELLLLLPCGLSLAATSGCYCAAIRLTSISTAVMLMYLAPVPVLLFSVLYFKERFTRKKAIGVGIMLIGCCLVSGVIGDFTPSLAGVIMGLLSALAYASYNILTKLAVSRGIDPFRATVYTFLFAALASTALCRPWEIPGALSKEPAVTLPLTAALGLMSCILPYLLYSLALRKLSVGTASALSIIEPLTAAILGFTVFREEFTALTLCGTLLIVIAVLLLGASEAGHSAEP